MYQDPKCSKEKRCKIEDILGLLSPFCEESLEVSDFRGRVPINIIKNPDLRALFAEHFVSFEKSPSPKANDSFTGEISDDEIDEFKIQHEHIQYSTAMTVKNNQKRSPIEYISKQTSTTKKTNNL